MKPVPLYGWVWCESRNAAHRSGAINCSSTTGHFHLQRGRRLDGEASAPAEIPTPPVTQCADCPHPEHALSACEACPCVRPSSDDRALGHGRTVRSSMRQASTPTTSSSR